MLIITNPTDDQIKEILTAVTKPIAIMAKETPGKEAIELIRKKEAGFGLIAAADADAAAYVQKLLETRKLIGPANLFIANEPCLWGEAGQKLMFQIIAELLKAKVEPGELGSLLSGNFLRLLSWARGEAAMPIPPR